MCWNNKHGCVSRIVGWGAGCAGLEKGFPALCEKWKWGGSFRRPILGPFLSAECKCQLRPDTLFYCVKTGKRSLNYLQINCLLPLSVPWGPIRECVWKSWVSGLPLHPLSGIPSHLPPPTRMPGQNHLWLPFLMTNFNALIRKHLRVHSSQTPYGAQYKICLFSWRQRLRKGQHFEYQLLFPHWVKNKFTVLQKRRQCFKEWRVFFFLYLAKLRGKDVLCENKAEFYF